MGFSARGRVWRSSGAVGVTLLAVTALALAGCSPAEGVGKATVQGEQETPHTPSARNAPEPALQKFYDQTPSWGTCKPALKDTECARVEVPINYAKPDGETIQIEVARSTRSQGMQAPILLTNPGGPGASGVNFLASAVSNMFSPSLLKNFAVLSFDPRGVGKSAPIRCLDAKELDAIRAQGGDAQAPNALNESQKIFREWGAKCAQANPKLLAHVSTVEAARDMDVIRAAMDKPKVSYLGYSYGTYLGAMYATLFPQRVEHMVLDGVLSSTLDVSGVARAQASGFEKALRHFFEFCVAQGDCALGSTPDAAVQKFRGFMTSIGKQPLPTADPQRPLTASLAYEGIFGPLYAELLYPQLKQALNQAVRDHDGSQLLLFADKYAEREADGTYSGNQMDAFIAINGLDYDPEGDAESWQSEAAQLRKDFPLTGAVFGLAPVQQSVWPVRPDNGINKRKVLDAAGAPPLLLIANTGDPATPLASAEAAAKSIPNSRLITWDSYTHTAYGWGSKCIQQAVDNYLLNGQLPEQGLACKD